MLSGDQGHTGGAGRLLAGRYRVTAQLGRGGMGVVWRAVDEVLHREVAVKELRTYTDAAGPELDDLRLRMQREARAAARVRHPGVVAVHDVAEVEGRPLIVMELVDGPSLDDVLRERGALTPREAAAIGAKVMEALSAAHRVGVLHRDVKPGNILLETPRAHGSAGAGEVPVGRVVLTDFGIATMEDPNDGSATRLTRSGELVGSLDYLAPERAQGHDPGPASDVWALGATLYAAVEGSSPFRRTSTWSTLTAIVADPLPEPQRSGPLAPVLKQLLHKEPQARPDAGAAGRLLADVAAGGAPGSGPQGEREAVPRAYESTRRSIPDGPPQGFGPPPSVVTSASSGRAETRSARRPRGGRALLAAAAVAVVLAATGATVAYLGGRDDGGQGRQDTAADGSGVADDGSRGPLGGGARDTEASKRDKEESREPDAKHPDGGGDEVTGRDKGKGKGKDGDKAAGEGEERGGEKGSGEDGPASRQDGSTAGPDDRDDKDGSGGGAAPVCHPVGGGKYHCAVWRTATSYTAAGAAAGTLKAGTNYFYCQQNLGRRETYGEWTNVWWAKTDDDSGNTGVFVSDVYIKGGDNDEPLPGLPTC
ncbi:serine/threonine-protein kinase [Streptomyces alfalfae]